MKKHNFFYLFIKYFLQFLIAFRLLGNWLQAAADLRLACKLDLDEQASEWLAEVQPNVNMNFDIICF